MSAPKETTPPEAPARPAKQGGEARLELRMRLGAEPEAWTERMLAALESGVKGGRWFSLHDKYPNRHFAEMGLFSLERAYREACQSRS